MARKLHSLREVALVRATRGGTLTTLFSTTAMATVAAPKKKRSLLPVLTVLFVISYGLMTMLIVEQGSAIQSQSNLIKVLLPDSRELWGLKGKAITDKAAKAKAQAQAQSHLPAAQAPPGDAQAQAAQPGTQVQERAHNRQGKTKPNVQFPPIPASDLNPARTVRTI